MALAQLDVRLQRRLLELYERCCQQKVIGSTLFLDPGQQVQAQAIARHLTGRQWALWGGYAQAERQVFFWLPDHWQALDLPASGLLSCFYLEPAQSGLTHRDYLGALMNLGLRREVMGDIRVKAEGAYLLALSEVSTYLLTNLTRVGSSSLKMRSCDFQEMANISQEMVKSQINVPSLRLDCVAAEAFSLSRSKISEQIKMGRVLVNWQVIQKPDKLLEAGDTLSMQGKGRVVIDQEVGLSKKGRLFVQISHPK